MFSFENLTLLQCGMPMPHFVAQSRTSPAFHFNAMGGRASVVLLACNGAVFGGSTQNEVLVLALKGEPKITCLAVLASDDAQRTTAQDQLPNFFALLDSPKAALYAQFCPHGQRRAIIVDPRLVVHAIIELGADGAADAALILQTYAQMLADFECKPFQHLPILTVPRVFEPELCRELQAYYRKHGGQDSGLIHQTAQGVVDYVVVKHEKIRQDCVIQDQSLIDTVLNRIRFRLVPQIYFAFQFKVERIERHMVSRYAAKDGAFFAPHRDNLAPLTAHRRFSVALNLNAEDYEGGDLIFPEFNKTPYRTPTGAATVFSSTLLHEVTRVTRGERFAYLPFLYTAEDEKRLMAAKAQAQRIAQQAPK